MTNPVITLTTDYGTSDHLVGVLKGVILRIAPNAALSSRKLDIIVQTIRETNLCF